MRSRAAKPPAGCENQGLSIALFRRPEPFGYAQDNLRRRAQCDVAEKCFKRHDHPVALAMALGHTGGVG